MDIGGRFHDNWNFDTGCVPDRSDGRVLLRKGWMKMDERKSVTEIIEEVCGDICDHYCKYGDTVDEDGECEVGRSGEECPLTRLY